MKPGRKYYPLYEYLEERAELTTEVELTFAQLESILDASLPASARKFRSWWANSQTSGRVQAAAWMEAGYHVTSVDLEQECVVFGHPGPEYRVARDPDKTKWDAVRVRALRRHMGLSQQELADRLNMRQQTVSEWETGQYQPRGGSIALLNLVAERAGFYETPSRESDNADAEGH